MLALRLAAFASGRFFRLRMSRLNERQTRPMDFRPELDSELARLGKELLDSLGADTAEAQSAIVQSMIEEMPEGELKELGRSILKLYEAEQSHEQVKKVQVKDALKRILDSSENDLDRVSADFAFNEGSKLNQRQLELAVEKQRVRSLIDIAQRGIAHEVELATKVEEFSAERERLADFASLIVAKATQHSPAQGSSQPAEQKDSILLSAVVEAFCDGQLAEGNWTSKTEQENRAILALWLRIVGDSPIAGYGYEQHRGYKAKLLKLPPNLNKNPRYRDKSIDAVLALRDAPAAPNTINKNLSRVAAFFTWAVAHGYTNLNPAIGMTLRNPKRANEERQAFNTVDLKRIFGSEAYKRQKHRKPYMHWAPLIALYSGARLNEIAQLHVADFTEDEGVPLISINDDGDGKRLKTKAAKRMIPVHSELVRLGLLSYVERLRLRKIPRLFPELELRRDGYGQTVSKWFARYCDSCGIKESGKVFHSFRHTVIDQLKQAGVTKEKIAALVGHEDESTTFGRYGKDFVPTVMTNVVESLDHAATKHLDVFQTRI